MVGAFIVGVVVVVVAGRFEFDSASVPFVAGPMLQMPVFTARALTELVIPLTVTVIAVQNAQGAAVLRAAGHQPPVNMITVVCGIWSGMAAAVGAVSTCLAGPTNALLVAEGPRQRQYVGALTFGALAVAVGIFAPMFVGAMRATPATFIATIGGLALLGALKSAFSAAFGDKYTLGALITFLVAVSDIDLLNIGAPFWGIVAGVAVSWAVERGDWHSDDRL